MLHGGLRVLASIEQAPRRPEVRVKVVDVAIKTGGRVEERTGFKLPLVDTEAEQVVRGDVRPTPPPSSRAHLTADLGSDVSSDDLLRLGIDQWQLESSALLDLAQHSHAGKGGIIDPMSAHS
jgi:hypothetical protein